MINTKTMTPLSETLEANGIAFSYPLVITDDCGLATYYEPRPNCWCRHEYDEVGRMISYSTSEGYWQRCSYDEKGNQTHYDDSNGVIRRK